MHFSLIAGLFLIFLLSLVYLFRVKAPKNNYNWPPGPWFKLPIVGHIPFLGSNPSVTFMQWSFTYGPVFFVQLGSFPTVIINDAKILKQVFSSAALAGRPNIKFLDDMSRRRGITFCDGPHSREQRRFSLKSLRSVTNPSELAETLILEEVDDFIKTLESAKGKPVNVNLLFNRNVINTLLGILISKKFEPGDAECDKLAKCVTDPLHQKGILPVLATYIPSLCSYFPHAVGHSIFENTGKELREFFIPFLRTHMATAIDGQPRDVMDTFVEKMAASKDDPGSSFHDVRNIEDTFRDLLAAALETTASQLEWIVHFMAKYPKVQDKLAEEIKEHLQCKGPPSLCDRPKLPYTAAIIHEALRISSMVPVGVPHTALEDTNIAGYRIPKGTLVIGNLYGMHHDPNVWQSPHEFMPERFITPEGVFSAGDKAVMAFGTGSRGCIGEGLAQNQLFLFTVRIFQKFGVKAVGKLCSTYEFSHTVAPKPFQVIFEPRN